MLDAVSKDIGLAFTLRLGVSNARDWFSLRECGDAILFHLLYNCKIFEKRFGNKKKFSEIFFMKYLAECMNVSLLTSPYLLASNSFFQFIRMHSHIPESSNT